jgi:hypothetical protein
MEWGEKMKTYFVSYFYKQKNGNFGVGNAIIGIDTPMETEEAIREVEKELRIGNNFAGLSLINYKEMNADNE